MYAFTYDTRRWRGLELKFLKQWGADMIIPGRFRGAFAAIACLNSKSYGQATKLWRDSKAYVVCADLPFIAGMFSFMVNREVEAYRFSAPSALSSM